MSPAKKPTKKAKTTGIYSLHNCTCLLKITYRRVTSRGRSGEGRLRITCDEPCQLCSHLASRPWTHSSSAQLLPPGPNASRVPSKLRASSTVSSLHREQRSSSPDSPTRLSSPAHSISTQASTVIRSPVVTNATLKSKQANGKGRGAPALPRIPSPPRPPPPVPVIKRAETDYLIGRWPAMSHVQHTTALTRCAILLQMWRVATRPALPPILIVTDSDLPPPRSQVDHEWDVCLLC